MGWRWVGAVRVPLGMALIDMAWRRKELATWQASDSERLDR